MDIRHYISQVEKTYNYRIKTVVALTDDAMGRIERLLLKYQPVDIKPPRKTMFQTNPLDFPSVASAEVHIVDICLGLPASSFNLARDIKDALGVPDKFVVVRGENDPTELETSAMNAKNEMDEAAEKEGAVPGALLDLPAYEEVDSKEASTYYGDDYNRRFMGYLKAVSADNAKAAEKNAPAPLYGTLKAKSDVAADEGPTLGATGGETNPDVSGKGNLDNDRKGYSRAYQKQGKVFVKREAGDPIRKDK